MKNSTLKFRRGSAESGQALVLIAMLMVILLVMCGLAIDGGGMFLKYRDAQNAADAAALSAAYALCAGSDYEAQAFEMASANGFDEADELVHDVSVTLTSDVASNNFEAPAGFVEVLITAEKPAYFIQLAYSGPLTVTARAVGVCTPQRVRPGLQALSTTCQDPMRITGSSIQILGSVVSNGDMNIASSSAYINGHGYYVGTDQSTSVMWDPNPDNPMVMNVPMEDREGFDIGDFAPGGDYATQDATLFTYSASDMRINTNSGAVVLNGLYFTDGDFQLIGDNYTVGPNGVTIVARGSISISATDVVLTPYVGGVLLFADATTTCGANAITVSSARATLEGLIYAPHGGVNLSDSDASISDGGIIAQTINIHASNTTISRLPEMFPASFGLYE